jgi:hypothetical protein
MAANPLTNASAYDKITLDKIPSPGFVRRSGGGDRDYKIDQAQAPGFGGGYTLFRHEELSKIEYRFFVFYDPSKPIKTFQADYAALEAFLFSLNKGNKLRPPKTYTFQDLYISHNAINSIVAQSVGPIEKDESKLLWSARVKFAEYKRLNLFGGAPKPPGNEREETASRLLNENSGLTEQIDGTLNAMRRNGEGRGI